MLRLVAPVERLCYNHTRFDALNRGAIIKIEGSGKRWTIQDRENNPIYLTQERWEHIIASHPELGGYEQHLQAAIKWGHRRQEPLNPRKYRYAIPFNDLPEDYNHIVVIVLFGFDIDQQGKTVPNNFVATAFMKHILEKGDRQ